MWRGAVLTVGLAWASVPLQAQEEVPNHFIVLLNDEEIEETGFLGDLIEELGMSSTGREGAEGHCLGMQFIWCPPMSSAESEYEALMKPF